MNRIKTIIIGLLVLVIGVYALWLGWKWGVERVFVPADKIAIVIKKYGQPLPAGITVIPPGEEGRYKGILEEVLGPGRYFINPIFYETEIRDVTLISAGQPEKWDWAPDGKLKNLETAPRVGLRIRKQGEPGQHEVVREGQKGIQQEVLTPGVYKINPYLFEIQQVPAVVIPPGSVGVVTRLFGEAGEVVSATLTEIVAVTTAPTTQETVEPALQQQLPSRLITGENQRGVLRDVLQPGIYYLNPRMYKVDILPIGYDIITLESRTRKGATSDQVRFLSSDGYQIEADFSMIWGIAPADAPTIVANIGSWDVIESNVIRQAMISGCQNVGAKYTAKALIQGETRSAFQDELEEYLKQQMGTRNIHVLLALIRNISIKDTTGKDQTDGLLATIQKANIEIERQITNRQKTETERKRAELEEVLKLVDVARESVAAETKVKVANILADGEKKAAEIDADRELQVSSIALEIANLDAQTTQILGKASADVERLRREAEARGAQMMVSAFGTPQAYINYTFARNFKPTELRLIFAGQGTFWTDLKSFEQVGASQVLQQQPTPGPQSDLPSRR